jgi:hypothetical protein
MALTTCPNCNNSISDFAINCPHCKFKVDGKFNSNLNSTFTITSNSNKIDDKSAIDIEYQLKDHTNNNEHSKKEANYKWAVFIIILFVFFQFINNYSSNSTEFKSTDVHNKSIENQLYNNSANSSENKKSTSNKNAASEEASRRAYRSGYEDGFLNFGDPSAPAYQYFFENHPEISGIDEFVYKMGYQDAILGKPSEY